MDKEIRVRRVDNGYALWIERSLAISKVFITTEDMIAYLEKYFRQKQRK